MLETCVVRAISPKHRPGVIRYCPVVGVICDIYNPVVSFDLRCQSAICTCYTCEIKQSNQNVQIGLLDSLYSHYM